MRRSSPFDLGILAKAAGLALELLGGNGGIALTGPGDAAGWPSALGGLVFDPMLQRGSSLLLEEC